MSRTYPVPARIASSPLLGTAATMSDIDILIESGYGNAAEREWAISVRDKFVKQQLDRVCDETGVLPRGLIASSGDIDIVVGLTDGDRTWSGCEWDDKFIGHDDVITLTSEEVAFSVEALTSGIGLALYAARPIAFLDRAVVAAPADGGMKVVAVVDEVDRDAVLELLAIAPGPIVFRRNDGKWERDNQWLRELEGIKPPPLVVLDEARAGAVIKQVDEATRGKEFMPTQASGFDQRLHDMQIEWILRGAMVADASSGGMPAKLKKYWVFGKGAAKIRWGTPGAMRRCHRQLLKYVGPGRAWSTCNNISKLRGGKGVAWDVG